MVNLETWYNLVMSYNKSQLKYKTFKKYTLGENWLKIGSVKSDSFKIMLIYFSEP